MRNQKYTLALSKWHRWQLDDIREAIAETLAQPILKAEEVSALKADIQAIEDAWDMHKEVAMCPAPSLFWQPTLMQSPLPERTANLLLAPEPAMEIAAAPTVPMIS